MKYSEIENMDIHALKEKKKELELQLGDKNLKKSIASGTIKDVSVFKKMRKTIAQISFKLAQTK